MIGTPAPPLTDASIAGSPVTDSTSPAVAITAATKLGGAGAGVLNPPIQPGDTIVVDGQTITFTNAGANTITTTGATLNVNTATVGNLLTAIDTITGTVASPKASTISATGSVSLHTGTSYTPSNNLSITTTTGTPLAGLGFSTTVTQPMGGGGTPGLGIVIGNDNAIFTKETISGGAVTAYDSTGTPVNLQLRWAKSDSSALGSPHTDTWNLFYQTNPNATGTTAAWVNAGTNFVFGPNGSLTSPTGSTITLNNVTVGNQSVGNLSMNFGSGGLTQYASTGGTATINQISQNGYAAGQLQSIAVNNNGLVVGTFSNGQNLDLAAVSMSHFNGTNYLKALDGGAYAVTNQSGVAIAGATGTISGSSLEGSNTDIADEFTKLIVTQQAYSANTKVITTANSMVQDLLNVLR